MSLKRRLARLYEGFFDEVRKYSAEKKRINQFRHKSQKDALNANQIQEVKEFYKNYRIPSMVFHRYFTEKTGEFHANYIPQDIYVGNIDPYFNDLRAAKYIDNKCYYDFFFHQVPQPYCVLKRMNNIWLTTDGCVVSVDEMKKIIAAEKEGLFVKKAQDTAGGQGVFFVEPSEDTYDKIDEFAKQAKTDIVIQRGIKQHADLAKYNRSSVNSLRMYSVLSKDGEATIYSSVLRIGVGNSKVDNYASGGVSCGIKEDGSLRKYAYNKQGVRVDKHPASGVVFEGERIPSYDKAVELVKKVHPTISHFRSVSWDLAIDENGDPLLIEVNLCRGGIDLLQLSNGPLFGKDTKKILDEVFKK